jgi:hypothetical protein
LNAEVINKMTSRLCLSLYELHGNLTYLRLFKGVQRAGKWPGWIYHDSAAAPEPQVITCRASLIDVSLSENRGCALL